MAKSAQIQKIGWWHEAIIDWMLANPEGTLRECAEHFGVTQAWLSIVKNSDCFQELFAERRRELSHQVTETLAGRVEALAETTIDRLQDRIERESALMEVDELRKVGEMALKALGFGARPTGINIRTGDGATLQFATVDREAVERARQRVRAREAAGTPALPPSEELPAGEPSPAGALVES